VVCACGKGDSLDSCCGPYLRGEKRPPTAEALMRSRYAAYVQGNIDYIIATHDPDRVSEVDRSSTETWSRQSEWLGLEILATERGTEDDDSGTVEFVARYKLKGVTVAHRERAEFRKLQGSWYFVDGKEIAGPPVKRTGPDIGRNDPCVCGSGKKYKKCCGRNA
jgi:SEC-C motif-containing protein